MYNNGEKDKEVNQLMRSSNPVFTNLEKQQFSTVSETATKNGVALKTLSLVVISLVTGFFSLQIAIIAPEFTLGIAAVSGIVSFIAVLIATFNPKIAGIMSIIYALFQGLLYGLITHLLDAMFPGVASIALLGTVIVFVVMFALYQSGLLRGSPLLRSVVYGALITILVGSLVATVISLVNPVFINSIYSYELAIGISLFLIVMGAFMLTLDFERAEQVVNSGLPKAYEWIVALGFMVTLIWIYYNILRFAVLVMGRNNN